jgi:hypothetical protein
VSDLGELPEGLNYFVEHIPHWGTTVRPVQVRAGRKEHPVGQISVESAREVPNFVRDRYTRELKENEFANYRADPPTELFNHRPPQVALAFVDPALKHTVPTAIGLAVLRQGAQHDSLMADSTLTRFSSHLAQKAASKGLPIVGHPDNPYMLNNSGPPEAEEERSPWDADPLHHEPMTDGPMNILWKTRNAQIASPHEVREAKGFIRSMLRPPVERTPETSQVPSAGPRFKQGTLF